MLNCLKSAIREIWQSTEDMAALNRAIKKTENMLNITVILSFWVMHRAKTPLHYECSMLSMPSNPNKK